jgi:membrane protein
MQQRASGIWNLLRSRLLAFGLVLATGFLLLVSLVVSTAITAFANWWGKIPGGWHGIIEALNIAISMLLATGLFAMIYKWMPRAKVAWHDVWIGAAVTAALFEIGKLLIGVYLGKTAIASAFGAAGSIIVLLVWVYYSAQIFLLGAEFTWVYANERKQREDGRAGEAAPAPAQLQSAALERSERVASRRRS